MLCDAYHRCQALADVQMLRERFGEERGRKLALIGDGNNVAQSLMLSAARLGMDFSLGCWEGFAPDAEVVTHAEGWRLSRGEPSKWYTMLRAR